MIADLAKIPDRWDGEADVVVAGGGAGGLAAAVEARDRGVSVILLEKEKDSSKSGSYCTTGVFAVGSSLQKEEGIDLSTDWAFKEIVEYAHWRNNAPLVRTVINKSGSTIDWLLRHGTTFRGVNPVHIDGNRVWHWYVKPPGPEFPLRESSHIPALTNYAREHGVKIMYETPAAELIKNKDGRVIGVTAIKDGRPFNIKANRGVILATGGFGANNEMLRKYTKWKQPGFYTGCPGSTGDGIRMAESAGADLDGMDVLLMFGVTASIPPDLPGLSSISNEPLLYVNKSGERVVNEWYQSWPEFGNAVVNQKDQTLILIFDEDSKNYFINHGKRRVFHGRKIGKIDNLDEQIQEGIRRGIVYQAATSVALAAQIGADPTILEMTITEYNKCCDKKHDEMFLKDPKYLDPVRKPPLYAIFFPDAFFCATLGGARINTKSQVLEAESFKTIPGLYAVGNDAAGMYGDTYTIHLPGMQQCFAINSGRIAGENVAAEIL